MAIQKIHLKQSNKRMSKIDMDKLAQSWCELLLKQIQEAKTQQSLDGAFEANKGENIYR